MEYAITKLAAGKHHSIPLSNTQFDEIKRNRSVLSAAFNFETCFDLFLRTFSEFEGARLDAALNNALYKITEYRDLFHLKQNCAAKFLATLNACKVYLYQSQKALKRIDTGSAQFQKTLSAHAYDSSVEYRVMEQLKNYAQHWHFDFGGLSLKATKDEGETRKLAFSSHLYLRKTDIDSDYDFKPTVLAEMEDRIDLTKYTARYVAEIQKMHVASRDEISPFVTGARECVEDWHEEWVKSSGESLVGLHAVCKSDGQIDESVTLLLEWDDVRRDLVERNSKVATLDKFYVSGKH